MPVRVPWRFYDPTVPEEWELQVNPNDGGTPANKKTITYQNTSAPDGLTLMFEGRDEVEQLAFSGVLLHQEQLQLFQTWFKKRHQVRLTDDLGRVFWVYITSFEPKRVRSRSHPWKHQYQATATVLDWPG